MEIFIVIVVGAIVGSFLNVCIYRIPLKKSIVSPRSYCPLCKKSIPWYDNIPIISYIFLMGRCGICRKSISLRYPLVEILTALLFFGIYNIYGLHLKFFAYSALACALLVATFIDFDYGEIPDEITIGGMVICLAASFVFPGIFDATSRIAAIKASALGLIVGGVPIYLMGVFGKIIFKKDAMGGGDVKLMALIGAMLGWKLALLTFFIAPFFGAGVGLFLRFVEGRETIPYGPYLSLAAIISMFIGNNILRILFYGM